MDLSVVIPTCNRPQFAVRAVVSVLEQTLLPDEILVVENGSGDETEQALRELRPVSVPLRYLVEPRPGVSRARNLGTAEAAGKLVAFLDDDSVASPEWLEALVGAASAPGVVAVAGRIALRWPCARPPWVTGLEGFYGSLDFGRERLELRYPRFPYASNMAADRTSLLSLGGFPPGLGRRGKSLLSNEEDGLFRRAADHGWLVVYEPRALVYHWVHVERLSRRWLVRRGFVQGRSDVLSEALFTHARTSRERLHRSRRALAAARTAWLEGSGSASASARRLAQASTKLGAAFEELRLVLDPARARDGQS